MAGKSHSIYGTVLRKMRGIAMCKMSIKIYKMSRNSQLFRTFSKFNNCKFWFFFVLCIIFPIHGIIYKIVKYDSFIFYELGFRFTLMLCLFWKCWFCIHKIYLKYIRCIFHMIVEGGRRGEQILQNSSLSGLFVFPLTLPPH